MAGLSWSLNLRLIWFPYLYQDHQRDITEEYKTVGRIKNVNAYWIKFKSDKWNPKNKCEDWLWLLDRWRPEGRPGRLIPSSQHSRPRRSVPVPAKPRRPLRVTVTPGSWSRAPPSSYQTDNTHSSTCMLPQSGHTGSTLGLAAGHSY